MSTASESMGSNPHQIPPSTSSCRNTAPLRAPRRALPQQHARHDERGGDHQEDPGLAVGQIGRGPAGHAAHQRDDRDDQRDESLHGDQVAGERERVRERRFRVTTDTFLDLLPAHITIRAHGQIVGHPDGRSRGADARGRIRVLSSSRRSSGCTRRQRRVRSVVSTEGELPHFR